jgi:hypothetical protein
MAEMGHSRRGWPMPPSIHVRSTSNTGRKFDASAPVAKCQKRP